MNRRNVLKILTLGIAGWGLAPEAMARDFNLSPVAHPENFDDSIRDYLHKMKYFNESHRDDIWIPRELDKTFRSTVSRLRRLEEITGHGNFQILSFDSGLRIAARYSEVGKFSREELDFMEMIFYSEAQRYGFLGIKPMNELTSRIRKRDVTKISYTGNHLYKGRPFETYRKIKQQVGESVILTSGVRGIMKQFLLFLNKAVKSEGNLSLASRSLAPPGYSFHGSGDFDVGQVGFGAENFTKRFTTTEVYRRLTDLGYLKLRYPQENLLGVRFEPWHVKMDSDV